MMQIIDKEGHFMPSEPLTLYKLMTLYMLKQVKFPLSSSQLSEFFLAKEYTTYFTLQQVLSELKDAHLITADTVGSSSRYEITREGEETLSFFENKISPAIIEDMDEFLKENKVRLRNEVGVNAEYYRSENQEYIVHCEVREGKSILIELNISVPDKEQAESMCLRWSSANQSIYSYVMKELMRQD